MKLITHSPELYALDCHTCPNTSKIHLNGTLTLCYALCPGRLYLQTYSSTWQYNFIFPVRTMSHGYRVVQ